MYVADGIGVGRDQGAQRGGARVFQNSRGTRPDRVPNSGEPLDLTARPPRAACALARAQDYMGRQASPV